MSTPLDLNLDEYKYGFNLPEDYAFKSRKGLDEQIVREISLMKKEPAWMTEFRLRAYRHFVARPMPTWGGHGLLKTIDFNDIYYYIKPTDAKKAYDSWDDVPSDIKNTFDRLGIPEAEQKFLAGVGAQYESEMVYHSIIESLTKQGVIFLDMDAALREYPEIVRQYFGTVIPPEDNKFAALNTAVWSGGSFIYVPPGVHVDLPLQAYFRINAQNMGQFERTLIIVDEGAFVHYTEGCTAPTYSTNSLHSAVVEIIVKQNGRCRYSTVQNWSHNVFNLVTKRAQAFKNATMEWVDGNIGCLAEGSTVTTPTGIKRIEDIAVGEKVLSLNESTGEFCFQAVVAKRFSGYQPVREVSAGERRILVTSNHPFYSYRYMPEQAKKLGRYQLGYVRADELTEAIIPRISIDYGQPYTEYEGEREVVIVGNSVTGHGSHRLEIPLDERFLPYLTTETREKAETTAQAKFAYYRHVGRSNIKLPDSLEIVKVSVGEPSTGKMATWDIEVEGTGNFVSEGFIVHNSMLTMKYPAVWLMEEGAHGEVLSIAFAGKGQIQDAGAKIVHAAPNTSSVVTSKSISKHGGRTTYRGLIKVAPNAHHSKSNVVCDALILDDLSASDTFPSIEIEAQEVSIGHEASVSKVSEEQLFYLMSRGIPEAQAANMIVSGFIEPIVKELPMEYALEMNRLIELEMEGAVG